MDVGNDRLLSKINGDNDEDDKSIEDDKVKGTKVQVSKVKKVSKKNAYLKGKKENLERNYI